MSGLGLNKCPNCDARLVEEKNTMTGEEIWDYWCPQCHWSKTENRGTALWKILAESAPMSERTWKDHGHDTFARDDYLIGEFRTEAEAHQAARKATERHARFQDEGLRDEVWVEAPTDSAEPDGQMQEVVEVVPNESTQPVEVWFEPWAEGISLPSGKQFRLVAQSEREGQLEIDGSPERIVVYGWPGSTLAVYEGETLVRHFDLPVPDIPPGMSMKAFVGMMFVGAQTRPPTPVTKKPWWRFW